MTAPCVTCPGCHGTGQRELTHTERVTLEAVRSEFTPTSEIRERLRNRVKASALCNRLVDLERLGLVEHRISETNHRIKEWRRVR